MAGTVARISAVPVPNRDLYNPALCPEALLPWLAWTFSLDDWNPQWSVAQKRQAITDSVYVHRHKGTIGAVRSALAALGYGAQVQEWFNQSPNGAPFTYQLLLDVDQVGIDQPGFVTVVDVVESAKNLRSHLDTIIPSIRTRDTLSIGGVCGSGNEITISYSGNLLILDGSWLLNGQYRLNGLKFNG